MLCLAHKLLDTLPSEGGDLMDNPEFGVGTSRQLLEDIAFRVMRYYSRHAQRYYDVPR